MAQPSNFQQIKAEQLFEQGVAQLNANQLEAALLSFRESLSLYQKAKNRSGEARATGNLGLVYGELKDYNQSINYLNKSLSIAHELRDSRLEANILSNMGVLYASLEDYTKAVDSFKQSLDLIQSTNDIHLKGSITVKLAVVYRRLGRYIEETEYLKQGLNISKETHNREEESRILIDLGLAYKELKDYDKAIKSFQSYLKIAKEIHSQSRWEALGEIGNIYYEKGEYDKAIKYIHQYLEAAKKFQNLQAEGGALGVLGIVYAKLEKYIKAITYLQSSLAIAQELKDKPLKMYALINLGSTYKRSKDYIKGIDFFQKSLKIAQALQDHTEESRILSNLGEAYFSLSEYAQSLKFSQESLKIAQEAKSYDIEMEVLEGLGDLHYALGDYPKMGEYYEQSLKLSRKLKNRFLEGVLLNKLGAFYRAFGDFDKAIDYRKQSLAIARERHDLLWEGVNLIDIGNVYLNLSDYAKALEYYQQSLRISKSQNNELGQGQVFSDMGVAYVGLQKLDKAIQLYRKSLTIIQKLNVRYLEPEVLTNLGVALLNSNRPIEAEKHLRDAINIYESLRQDLGDVHKVSIFENQTVAYNALQQVLVRENQSEAALEVSERGRTRAFVELLVKRLASAKAPNQLAKRSDSFVTESAAKALSVQQIQQIARTQKVTLVQYSEIEGDGELYIWVVTPSGLITFRKSDLSILKTPLSQLVAESRTSIGVRSRATLIISSQTDPAQQKQRLQQLHEILIKPIADLLPKDPNDRVIFIPQQELFLVPFPALQDANGKYLIEKHTILTAPSIQVLDQTHQLQQPRQSNPATETLVVGNPLMPIVTPYPGEPPQQLNPLPGAEAEANAIAPLLKTQALTGTQGTKASIKQKMSHARIIHLATHGLLDDLRGLGSAIALAPDHPGTPNDGLLTAEEILELKLSADLVVLSACDTGRGRITGDGVIGLSRSFISAGVPSIIVSLWAVPDAPTAELMTEFYTNWQVKKLDKAQSLRQAMLSTMKAHPNPRDWAAFTLIGEAE